MRRLVLCGLWVVLASACNCQGVDPGPQPGAQGSVSGTLTLFQSSGTGIWTGPRPTLPKGFETVPPKLSPLGPRPALRAPPVAQYVPGELVVRLEESGVAPQAAMELLGATGDIRVAHKGFASEHLHLLRYVDAQGQPLEGKALEAVRQALLARPGVRFAERNGRRYATALPNDKLYGYQWHYPAMNLPAAWDITLGSTGVVIAVLDTGIVPHADLAARLVQGIDVITDADMAQDGDGRDNDATDMGRDLPNAQSSWHGTHVAGTIGAVSNNDKDVSGVDWNARILPVRVLGKGGGTDFDIAAAIEWASGGSVPGLRTNTTPAVVLNMSLGGTGDPSAVYQDVINAAVGRGAVIVVAAGNENENTARKVPCAQDKVVCVGATRFTGKRSSFSNYGTQVDVMAPGGEMVEDLNGDELPDGVLSTYRDAQNQPTVELLQGTSMATPHVAGLVGLMKAVSPGLTPAAAETMLKNTATASSRCTEGCGAGLVNAFAAVNAAKGAVPVGPARLSVTSAELTLLGNAPTPLGVSNLGGQALTVTFSASGPNGNRLSFPSGATLTLAPGESGQLVVQANATGLNAGTYAAVVEAASNGGAASVRSGVDRHLQRQRTQRQPAELSLGCHAHARSRRVRAVGRSGERDGVECRHLRGGGGSGLQRRRCQRQRAHSRRERGQHQVRDAGDSVSRHRRRMAGGGRRRGQPRAGLCVQVQRPAREVLRLRGGGRGRGRRVLRGGRTRGPLPELRQPGGD